MGIEALVVEDEDLMRMVIVRILRKMCDENDEPIFSCVREAADGADARKMCQEHPDIVFVTMDYTMPGENGNAVTRALMQTNPQLQVVGITGSVGECNGAMLQAGAKDVLDKAVDLVSNLKRFIVQHVLSEVRRSSAQ